MRPIPIVMISIQARKVVKVSIIMIATRRIKIENVTVEQNTVAATMFGANTLQSVNTSDSGVPFAQYETVITLAGVTNLRFPAGTGEVLNNLVVGSSANALALILWRFWIGSARKMHKDKIWVCGEQLVIKRRDQCLDIRHLRQAALRVFNCAMIQHNASFPCDHFTNSNGHF